MHYAPSTLEKNRRSLVIIYESILNISSPALSWNDITFAIALDILLHTPTLKTFNFLPITNTTLEMPFVPPQGGFHIKDTVKYSSRYGDETFTIVDESWSMTWGSLGKQVRQVQWKYKCQSSGMKKAVWIKEKHLSRPDVSQPSFLCENESDSV
jgi:hypothetical protein